MPDSHYSLVLRKHIEQLPDTVDLSVSPWKEFIEAANASFCECESKLEVVEKALTQSAEELVLANEEMSAVFQAIPDQSFHLDLKGRIVSYKLGQSSHHYLKQDRLINRYFKDVTDIEVAEKFDVSVNEVAERSTIKNFEFIIVHEKRIFYYEVRMMPLKSQAVIALVRDITERKLAEEQIAFLAYHDSLTALPNNRFFKERLQHAIDQAERNKKMLAVMFLDLDRFKLINDTMGHSAGDELLKIISQRLIEAVRKTDSVAINVGGLNSSVARLGGDEFTILLEDIEGAKSVIRVAERIIENICMPMMLGHQEVYISTSIGISMYPEDAKEADEILKFADMAMYHAKTQGRNNFQFYAESMNESSVELLALENSLHNAIKQKELCLYYQPQINVLSGKLTGMEALIRWKHPEKGFISPGVFIPVAEETGMIMEIGEWVLREACEQGKNWLDAGYHLHKISVNLSARQLKDEGISRLIDRILKETGLPSDKLGIELTESAIILEPDLVLLRLQRIKELGVTLSLDDFGTGYSSLSYLKRFPIDTLKIDQAFVRDVKADHEDGALVKAIITMAHGLGMDVVAEGVEVQGQMDFLAANECDTIQGYLFSRPLPPAELEALLKKVEDQE
ncbi:diguanylate cyclase/phosphodiesterase (GGDEF & EAL domains) with PAS/PAC sensor(s) [hydrothermal vent metagenome]|uniref:Diguanylate cyclase/phosphodiesterase (GGDEF & EAL domains) with PAS/PAC sensor(S) n=1 Tax=hydrothermal vent metagenome TaxID=652676 RepID=A0A3B0XRT0_9ZZZZ